MKADCILLRYGELTLKGKNKKEFERILADNIRSKLGAVKINKTYGRMFVESKHIPLQTIKSALGEIFGLVGYSPAFRIGHSLPEIEASVMQLVMLHIDKIRNFKVVTNRADKSYPLNSQQLNCHLGDLILKKLDHLKVDVHHPDLFVNVEIRKEHTYVFGNDIRGLGGLPVGSSGNVLLLLSGGIDSPVAGYLSLKRGVRLHCVHFHSYPYTSERAKQKVIDLAQKLTRFGGKICLHMVPFTDLQVAIKNACYDSYIITIMRRMMMRIAERIAAEHKLITLLTGESLGQVASQTLESMKAINAVTSIPVLRPLITMDKNEIIKIAKEIETFDLSILPYEDCCTLFVPKAPKTKPDIVAVERQEDRIAYEPLLAEAISKTELIEIADNDKKEFSYF